EAPAMQLESVRELKDNLTRTLASAWDTTQPVRTRGNVRGPSGTPGALALGVARRGRQDYVLAVRVQGDPAYTSPRLEMIERQARGGGGVRPIGRGDNQGAPPLPWHRTCTRPLRIGSSIGHVDFPAGTLGCFVRRGDNGRVLILSNNHVLANENRARPGDPVLQPGRLDLGRHPDDAVGELFEF